MDVKKTADAMSASMEVDRKAGYKALMEQGPIQMLISMVPRTEVPDLLQTLLRACYDQGFNQGQNSLSIELAKNVFKDIRHGD